MARDEGAKETCWEPRDDAERHAAAAREDEAIATEALTSFAALLAEEGVSREDIERQTLRIARELPLFRLPAARIRAIVAQVAGA